jgi:Ca-activated chloride channel homolog
MSRLVEKLGANDRVAVVVYAGSSGMVLDSTVATPRNKRDILAALDRLQAGGSTNGGQGIELAYATAASRFIEGGVNRVILCTDGDFNVGVTDQGSLTRLIEEKAKSGVFLSVLGFGMGNVKDATMEQLADKGNGNYAYIDTILEGHKVLVEQMSGTLVTIAKDVKIQVEFNPAAAGGYRLIGYENRLLAKEDFNDDKKDAGEIGAGHTVTALYEVVPAGRKVDGGGAVDPLKYQAPATRPAAQQQPFADELLTLKLRYKQPDGDTSKLLEFPVKNAAKRFADTSGDFKFAAGVAGFGMILRDSPHKGSATLGAVLEWAGEGVGADEHGYRAEFVELVKKAKGLKPE